MTDIDELNPVRNSLSGATPLLYGEGKLRCADESERTFAMLTGICESYRSWPEKWSVWNNVPQNDVKEDKWNAIWLK